MDCCSRFNNNIHIYRVYRKGLDDSRHLIRRQRTRHDAVQSLKANQMAYLPQSFWAPLIPCELDLDFSVCFSELYICLLYTLILAPTGISINFKQKNPEHIETVETRANFEKLGVRTCDDRPPEGVAPSTPVTHSNSLWCNDIHGVSNSERVAHASSFETIENDPSLDEDGESHVSLINEVINAVSRLRLLLFNHIHLM